VGFQDLFLAFSQGLDLGRFAVPAAFRPARNLDQISGRGFENVGIRISKCKSSRSVSALRMPATRSPSGPVASWLFFRVDFGRTDKLGDRRVHFSAGSISVSSPTTDLHLTSLFTALFLQNDFFAFVVFVRRVAPETDELRLESSAPF
jgi:hypothetical protein